MRILRAFGVTLLSLLANLTLVEPADAQQSGGVLRITHRDSPARMSIDEEGTISVVLPVINDHGQQHFRRLAARGCLAQPLTVPVLQTT